jgi:hypothetical protein
VIRWPDRRPLLLIALALWLPLLIWWLAMLPGAYSTDSLVSWTQIETGHWGNHHPFPFTAFVWLTSFGGHQPATVSFVGTALFALALAFLVRVLGEAFGTQLAPFAMAFLLCVLPLVGVFASTVWKDIPETIVLIALQALLLRAVVTDQVSRRWWLGLGLLCLSAALVRWNGVATVIVAAVICVFALPRAIRLWAPALMVVAAVVGFLVLTTVPKVTSVTPLSPVDSHIVQISDLAYLARHDPSGLAPQVRETMQRFAPIQRWARYGRNCLTALPAGKFFGGHGQAAAAVRTDIGQLSSAWWQTFRRDPSGVLQIRLCRASLAWNPVDPSDGTVHTIQIGVMRNRYGIRPGGWGPLRRVATSYASIDNSTAMHVLAWRPALWLLALIGVTVAAARRAGDRARRLILLTVPIGTVASFAAAPAAQSARYTYAAVVICQLGLAAIAQQWLAGRHKAPR